MRNTLFLLTVILFSIMGSAQTNFEPGYFIDRDNKKVNCLIKNVRWLNAPEKVFYKMGPEDEVVSFDADMVKAFQIGDNHYLSVLAKFPETERFVNAKSNLKEPKLVERTIFAKQVVKGTASLYQYRANNDEVFLLQVEAASPLPLIYKEYILGNSNDVRKNNSYKRQLLKYLNCNPASAVQKVSYTKSSLSDYVKLHNSCLGNGEEEKSVSNKKLNNTLQFKVIGGVMFYGYETIIENVNVDYESKPSPMIGFELEKYLPFNNNKWAIFLSGVYASYSTQGLADETEVSSLRLNQLIFDLGGRHYIYTNQNSGVFLDAGITLTSNIKREFTLVEGISAARTDVLPFNFGAAFGGGYSFHGKYQIGARYFLGTSINEDATDENNLKRFSIFASIKL